MPIQDQEPIPISELAPHFTYSLYSNICRSLFEKDKLLFSFMLAAKMAQAKGDITSGDFETLVGVQEFLGNSPSVTPNECSSWLPQSRWRALCQMASESPILDLLVRDFSNHEEAWKKISESERPLLEEFPLAETEGGAEKLGAFTKLCLVKVLAPGKFIPAVRDYVLQESGEEYLNPPLFDIECSYEDSTCFDPLIFVLPGADPLKALTAFAQRKKKLESLCTISLG